MTDRSMTHLFQHMLWWAATRPDRSAGYSTVRFLFATAKEYGVDLLPMLERESELLRTIADLAGPHATEPIVMRR